MIEIAGSAIERKRNGDIRIGFAPALRQRPQCVGKSHLLERGGTQPPENAPVDLLQGGDLRIDARAIVGETRGVGARSGGAARQRADAGADSEEEGTDLVMQVARDILALFVLHMNHAPHQPAIFFVELLQRRGQRIDPLRDDDEFRRAVGGNAHRMFAAFQTL